MYDTRLAMAPVGPGTVGFYNDRGEEIDRSSDPAAIEFYAYALWLSRKVYQQLTAKGTERVN